MLGRDWDWTGAEAAAQRTANAGNTGSTEDVLERGDLQLAYYALLHGIGANSLLADLACDSSVLQLAMDALLQVCIPAAVSFSLHASHSVGLSVLYPGRSGDCRASRVCRSLSDLQKDSRTCTQTTHLYSYVLLYSYVHSSEGAPAGLLLLFLCCVIAVHIHGKADLREPWASCGLLNATSL
jgi:hypothetical protein